MTADSSVYLAAVEGGGTTFVVSIACILNTDSLDENNSTIDIGSNRLQLLHTATIPKRDEVTGEIPNNYTPKQILDEACSFFREHMPPNNGHYSALGIATFGPAGVDQNNSKLYGTILSGSPKKQWRGVDILSPIREACGLVGEHFDKRVAFETDVNAPAMAEFRHRCHLQRQQSNDSNNTKALTSLSYVTIGTGVGVGLVLNSQPLHGLLHPEGGHICIQPLQGDNFSGYSWGAKSPYKGIGTVEGMASSVALTERLIQMENEGNVIVDDANKTDGNDKNGDNAQTREVLSTLPDNHPVWLHASNAIANLCVSILLLTSCQKIVLGGGIMKREILYPMIRSRVWTLLNGYLDSVEELSEESKLEEVIVKSSWQEVGSGLVGAFALALDAYDRDVDVEETEDVSRGDKKKEELTDNEQRVYTYGVLVGIGLSFASTIMMSLFTRSPPRR